MPFYLKEVDVIPDVISCESVLIVPCRLCPAVSLAARNNRPFIEPYRGHLRTACSEDHISNMESRLEAEGIKVDVFRSSVLSYVHCMWTSKKREKLRKRVSGYDAVVVVGCDAAYESVCDLLRSTNCRVFKGMETEGLLHATPRLAWPLSLSLRPLSVTEMHHQTVG